MSTSAETGPGAVAALCDAFFTAHLEAHPEESSTLGRRNEAARLSDPSADAASAELLRLQATLREVENLTADAALDLNARLDLDAVARAARFQVRWLAADGDAANLELATLPSSALQHGALHLQRAADVTALAARAAAVPRFLAEHAENLRRGVREGRAPDQAVVATFRDRVLPGAARACQALAADVAARLALTGIEAPAAMVHLAQAAHEASAAYLGFAQLVGAELAPAARRDVKLGAPEVEFRLRDVMGLQGSIEDLLALAQHSLQRAHATLVEQVQAAGHPSVRSAADARPALLAVLAPKPAALSAALALYQRHLDAATHFVKERALVPVPATLALALEPLPAGIADGGTLTNWPAPLLDPQGKGHALYATDPAAHPTVQAKNLAVHEGIPGHYLQSAWWQQGSPSPVRFLGVTDDIAMSRGYFGTMLAVEGWAVHMEQLLLAEGFYDPGPERIFFAFCDMIRAMRVILDLQLHARALDEDEAARLVMDATLMPEAWARSQVLRAKRIPLQSLTYLVGSTEIAALRAGAGAHLSALEFHRALLSAGPVPPSRLHQLLRPHR